MDSEFSTLALEPASVWRRLAALCYDLLLLTALVFSFTLLVLAVRLGAPVPPGTWWFPSSLLAIAMAFFCGFWVHGGQTLGMRAW
ncbi:MAG TPA: RDD family protein, partial [Gammaproteobacteria bacterium]|nr:RDD family protein [Gammaproteobacteria bacterium]